MTERPDDTTQDAGDGVTDEIAELVQQFKAFVSALWNSSGRRDFVLLSVGIVTVIIEIWEALANEREHRPSADAEPEHAHSEP